MIDIQNWPLNIDFTIAVQNPQLCFADPDLKQASTSKNSRGRVLLWSGNFATVYKLTNKLSTGDRAWAVRCFTRIPQSDVQHRYKLISEYLSQHQTSYLVDFEFLSQGILVKGEWYPILKMDWVEGVEIDRYIGEYIDDSQVLLRLDRQLKRLQKDLQKIGIAHGDLQHGNIMIDDEGEIKLVDYDGMYVPALQGNPPSEIGHPNYQPPMRSAQDFSDRLDDFSFAVISLSLRALAIDPNLWETFHEDNKNLIFRQNDFQEPKLSPVFQAIAQIPDDQIRDLSDRLIDRCLGKDRSELKKQKSVVTPQKSILLLGIFLLAIGGLLLFFKKSQPAIKTSEVPIINSPTPINSTTPVALSTPKLTPITAVSLLTRYAEGQRDFRYIQLTGTQGDRLQGQDLRNINLSGSVLERVDLRQVIFKNANLNGIKLVKVDLRGVDLSNSSLIDANLAFSNLSEANLSQANLLRANLSQAKLGSAILQKAELMKSNLSEADLSLANLNGANLVLANLRKANLVKANLRDSNLAAANLSDAILDGADLSAADMRSAELHLTNLSNANLSSANLTAAKLILIEFAGTNLNGANFRNAIVENVGSIESANFSNVSNLSPNVRKYFCSLASGNIADTGNSTKSTLNCGL